MYYLKSRYFDPGICRFINADNASLVGANGDVVSYNLFAYCGDNPVNRTDDGGTNPKWWQWAVSGAMVATGIALVATGVGGPVGGALICAGANSIVGSYVSESTGGSSNAGWVGGMVTGAACGTGAWYGGILFEGATESVGAACLGKLTGSIGISFASGFVGSGMGQIISSAIDGKEIDLHNMLESAIAVGEVNCFCGIASGMCNGMSIMPKISTTTNACATMLSTGWSIISEAISDFVETIFNLFN